MVVSGHNLHVMLNDNLDNTIYPSDFNMPTHKIVVDVPKCNWFLIPESTYKPTYLHEYMNANFHTLYFPSEKLLVIQEPCGIANSDSWAKAHFECETQEIAELIIHRLLKIFKS